MPQRKKRAKHDVFSDGEDSDTPAGTSNRMDRVENYEYDPETLVISDDEEIDESEAFDSEDEIKYSESFKDSSLNVVTAENILDDSAEESSGHESEDDGDMMDISDMLDSDKPPKARVPDFATIYSDDSDSQTRPIFSSDDDESDADDFPDDGQDHLQDLIQSLDKKNEKMSRKRGVEELTEAFEESEYNINSRETEGDLPGMKKKVMLQELIGALPENTSFGNLKKKIVKLDVSDRKTGLGDTVSAPLHKRAHDRLNREAAYMEAKSQVKKWVGIVQKNRKADTLSFSAPEVAKTTNNGLVNKFKPKTEMEKEIGKMLGEGGLTESRQLQMEEMEMNMLSKEEIAKRRAELAKMRSLMFFQEQKRKKIAKIKSKTYRKLNKKKGEDPEELDINTLKSFDPEAARERMIVIERERALERMTLKHRNSGKWAKKMKGRSIDSETRKALMDQLEKHDELKKKIQGFGSDDSDQEGNEDDEIDNPESIAKALESLEKVNTSIDETEIPNTGVFAMKFMRKHVEAEIEGSKRDARECMDDFLNGENDGLEKQDNEDGKQSTLGPRAFNSGGKWKSRPFELSINDDVSKVPETLTMSRPVPVNRDHLEGSKKPMLEPLFAVEPFVDKKSSVRLDSNSTDIKLALSAPKIEENRSAASEDDNSDAVDDTLDEPQPDSVDPSEDEDESVNPWLKTSTKPLMKSLKNSASDKFSRVGKQTRALEKLAKTRKEFVSSNSLALESPSVLSLDVDSKKSKQSDMASSESDSDFEKEKVTMAHKGDVGGISQMQVMEMAFADDNIVEEFLAEKEAVVEHDMPAEKDATLPGWGSWSGNGIKPKQNVVVEKVKNSDAIEARKRRDASLKHVIINERRQKKYLAPKVPHGFENREQYERSIRAPLGKEWQTSTSHEILSRPRVETVPGVAIQPLKIHSRIGR